jgi:hypothetical protein
MLRHYGVAYHGYSQVTARICSLYHLPDSRYIKAQNYPSVPKNLAHIITTVFQTLKKTCELMVILWISLTWIEIMKICS